MAYYNKIYFTPFIASHIRAVALFCKKSVKGWACGNLLHTATTTGAMAIATDLSGRLCYTRGNFFAKPVRERKGVWLNSISIIPQ